MSDSTIPGDLPKEWRDRAALLREYGDRNSARLWELAAVELDRALRVLGQTTLSIAEAARESDYSRDHLRRLVKQGAIPNAGRSGAPRVRRCDLPKKDPQGPGRPKRRAVASSHLSAVARSFGRED